jgi:lambda family phage portal protein
MPLLSSLRNLLYGPPVSTAIPEIRLKERAEGPLLPPGLAPGSLWSKEDAWLDRALNPFSERLYDAAAVRPYTADWQGFATSGSYEILNAWRRVCYLARDLERNNSHAISFLRELRNNVLGSTGIRMQPRVTLQRGGKLNKPLNALIKAAWLDFRRSGVYEVTEQWSGQTLDELCLTRMATDGGVLLRLHRGYPNKYRFAVQAMEIDSLDIMANVSNPPGSNRITTGVETNDLGKPVAYHCLDFYQADLWSNQITGKRVRVPAEDMLHLWLPQRITSVRGISWFTSAMIDLRMLGKYEEAAVISARNAAAKMGFYERDQDAPRYEGQGQRPDGSIIEEITPGLIGELPPGYKFRPFDPGQPNEQYPHFKKGILRTISSGLGVMYNTLANDLESVNFSSSRYGKSVENESWKCLQRFLIEQLLAKIFKAWLECAVMAGAVPLPFSQIEEVCKSIVWRPRGWSYVDPTKETQSALASIDGGLTTRRKELGDLGIDYDEFLDEVEAEREEQEERQIVFTNPYSRQPEVESTTEDPEVAPGHNPLAESNGSNGSARPAKRA